MECCGQICFPQKQTQLDELARTVQRHSWRHSASDFLGSKLTQVSLLIWEPVSGGMHTEEAVVQVALVQAPNSFSYMSIFVLPEFKCSLLIHQWRTPTAFSSPVEMRDKAGVVHKLIASNCKSSDGLR